MKKMMDPRVFITTIILHHLLFWTSTIATSHYSAKWKDKREKEIERDASSLTGSRFNADAIQKVKSDKRSAQRAIMLTGDYSRERFENAPVEKGLWGKRNIKRLNSESSKNNFATESFAKDSGENGFDSQQNINFRKSKQFKDSYTTARYTSGPVEKGLWGKRKIKLQNLETLKDNYDSEKYESGPVEKGLWGKRNIKHRNLKSLKDDDSAESYANNPVKKEFWDKIKIKNRDMRRSKDNYASKKYGDAPIEKGLWGKKDVYTDAKAFRDSYSDRNYMGGLVKKGSSGERKNLKVELEDDYAIGNYEIDPFKKRLEKEQNIISQKSDKTNDNYATERFDGGPVEKGLWGKRNIKHHKSKVREKDYVNARVKDSTVYKGLLEKRSHLRGIRSVGGSGTTLDMKTEHSSMKKINNEKSHQIRDIFDHELQTDFTSNMQELGKVDESKMSNSRDERMLKVLNTEMKRTGQDHNLDDKSTEKSDETIGPVEKGLWGKRNILLSVRKLLE